MLHKYCYQLFTLAWSRPRGGIEGPKGGERDRNTESTFGARVGDLAVLRDMSWSGGSVIRGLVAIGGTIRSGYDVAYERNASRAPGL